MDEISKQIQSFEKDFKVIALSMAKGFGPTMADELIQAGRCGTWIAIQSYDASKGATLKTHVINKARQAMIDYLRGIDHMSRAERKKQRAGEAVDPIQFSYSELGADDLMSCTDTPDQYLQAKDVAESVGRFIAKGRHGSVFKQYAIDGDNMKVIGDDYGVSSATISLRIAQCCRDLSERLGYANLKVREHSKAARV